MNNKELIKHLRETNFIPSKKMGQNFLICNNYKNLIVNSLDIQEEDNIIEIGPGFGALTSLIINKTNKLKLVELDKRIHAHLKENFLGIEIINNNILDINLDDICIKDETNKIISNLPYSISSKAIVKIIKCKYIESSILMIQKEVAERIIAKECSKNYNGFSVFIQLVCETKKLFDVPNTVFYPKPNVTSSVIKLTRKNNLDFDIDKIEKFIRKCFGQKRKTIFNNLKEFFNHEDIINALLKLEIDKNRRPETLLLEQYKKLFLYLNFTYFF
ncbi:MAG: 16S rRNA (adenine(1518)-N(6)/adenine(1519)-N(6))-dimethyltransferase RsmA [Mycoplasmoidaceae bacterium]